MNTHKISPDDPRLTSYALDEMDLPERAEFSQLLQDDPIARSAVDEIRAMAGVLGAALRDEPASAAARLAVPASDAKFPATVAGVSPRARLLRFPQLYFYISGLAAACFAVVFALHESRIAARNDRMKDNSVIVAGRRSRDEFAPAISGLMNMPAAASKAAAAAEPLPLIAAETTVADRFFPTAEAATSTFPLQVGRASYDAVRALLRRGVRPARTSVQVTEMINAFTYSWPAPAAGEAFSSVLEETEAPWAPAHRLVRVGLKARDGHGPLANDARVEVEFNPARVLAWRLVGFERDGAAAGVHVDDGETVAAGDAVTVLYELVPAAVVAPDADPNLLRLALTYREPVSRDAQIFERTLRAGGIAFAKASPDMKFATAVAAFGLRLRDSTAQAPVPLEEIEQWARAGGDGAERTEFLGLVRATSRMLR